jgi:uncharacterized protein YjbI with pentapeptide repeats
MVKSVMKIIKWSFPILLACIVIAVHYFWLSKGLFSEFTCEGEKCGGYIEIFTHIAAVITLYFFALRLYHQEKQVGIQIQQTANQKEQIELQIKHRIDDRFKSSIELLGGDDISVRIGGIYSLFYLATEEDKYRNTIANILCSYIRSRTQEEDYQLNNSNAPSNEVQVTIDLLFKEDGLFKKHFDDILNSANLRGSYLIGADFSGSECKMIDFEGSDLEKSNFENANSESSSFESCSCKDAIFTYAIMEKTRLKKADFSGAEFSFCKLNKSSVFNTDFSNAKFHDTEFKKVHCSGDATFSDNVRVNNGSPTEKEVHESGFKSVTSMFPEGDYTLNPSGSENN